jgi:hypothetical protein
MLRRAPEFFVRCKAILQRLSGREIEAVRNRIKNDQVAFEKRGMKSVMKQDEGHEKSF